MFYYTATMTVGKNHIITHRGLEPSKKNFYSESSYEAFQDHLSRGFGGIEFDPNPTLDGIVVYHDGTLERPTHGKDTRPFHAVLSSEITKIKLDNGRIPSLDDALALIRKYQGQMNSMHLKARCQTPEILDKILNTLSSYQDVLQKLIIFDVLPGTARYLKQKNPELRLAPSVADAYDIQRYNSAVGGTLLSIDEVLALKRDKVIDGVWGDEWDRIGENGKDKKFYTKENFDRLKNAGLFIVLVTPELHATSPGLYGGESHADARDKNALMQRIKEIMEAGADYVCTDFPEEVAQLSF